MEVLYSILINLMLFSIIIFLGVAIYFVVSIGNSYIDKGKNLIVTKKQIFNVLLILIFIIILFIIFWLRDLIIPLLSPFIISIAVAFLLNPVVNAMERKGIGRTWVILLVYILLAGAVVVISILIIPRLTKEFQNLVKLLPYYFNKLYTIFNDMYIRYSKNVESLPPEFQTIDEVIRGNLDKVQGMIVSAIKNVTSSIINIFSKIFNIILIPILTFYYLKDKEFFKKKIKLTIPKKYRKDVLKVGREVDIVLSKFIRGQMIVAAFVGIATTIGLIILGIDFAFIIGVIAGVSNVIPYFGPIIGVIPAVLFALLEAPGKVVWVIIIFTLIQQVESNVLTPKIVGKSVGLHPVMVILSLLIGGSFYGILGMLLAVPIAAALKIMSAFVIEKITRL